MKNINILIFVLFIFSYTYVFGQKISFGRSNTNVFYICDDGTISAIGWNNNGQLGDGSKIRRTYPVKVKGLQNVTDVNGTGYMALKSDGTVWQWYRNGEYNLKKIPIENVVDISCSYASRFHNDTIMYYLAVKADGTVWAWGNHNSVEPDNWGYNDSIQQVPITNVKQVEAGNNTAVALCNDGTVWTWGTNIVNGNGEVIESGQHRYRYVPEKVHSLNNVVDVEAFTSLVYALKSDGDIWRWGYIGSINNEYSPVKMNISNVNSINVESWMITAINDKDSLFAFYHHNIPSNYYLSSWKYFQKIEGVSNVKFATQGGLSGNDSYFAITYDDEMYRWGDNSNGRLGNLTYYDIEYPEHMPRPCLSVDCDTITKEWDTLVLDTLVQPGKPVTLRCSESEADLYWWYPQNKIISNRYAQEVSVSITKDSEFEAVLMDTYGCMRKERFNLRKLCDTTSTIVLDTVLNKGSTIQLNPGPGMIYTVYNWTPDSNLSCKCKNPIATIVDSVTYTVTYDDEYRCKRKEKFIIRTPNCDTIVPYYDKLMTDTVIEPGSQIQLFSSDAVSHSWTPQKGLSCTDCQNPLVDINTDAEYTVTLTDDNSCNWTERFKIKYNCDTTSLYNPIIKQDTIIGPETEVQLYPTLGSDYSWFPEDGLSCTTCQSPTAYIDDSFEYQVTYRDSLNCFVKEQFIFRLRNCDTIVIANDILQLDTIINYQTTFNLYAKEGQINYEWLPFEGLSCTDCQSPLVSINESREYSVISYGKYKCPLTERFKISKETIDVFIPNAITPNNDGINDRFEIAGLIPGSTLQIYDSSGHLVFKSTDYDNKWQGTDLSGNKIPHNNTYWYLLQTPKGEIYKGWVFVK
ncbi:gliding motility-associated C-terminal domain-containing protein [Carboxylicivirga sp. RSCT41]|uniref:T9SS type B sorting domain-containing protein n=1 Tax=Carboxylicivirga agarovorans TaxID=3417570 RepID=UPI003D330D68